MEEEIGSVQVRHLMIRVLELFGGIGACTKALERLGIEFEIADYVEINQYAVNSFNAMHGTNYQPQDICTWDKDIDVDLVMHGSPCQDFSLAGRRAGGDEGSGTRSSLMYETLRIVDKLRPSYVMWENVKNVKSQAHIHNFNKYLNRMEEMGYANYEKLMNAHDYGIPQGREREIVISIKSEVQKMFKFPEPQTLDKPFTDYLEEDTDPKYIITDYILDKLMVGEPTGEYIPIKVANTEGWQPCHLYDTIRYEFPNSNLTRGRVGYGEVHTICCSVNQAVVISMDPIIIRRITPRECWRLMGFDDEDYDKASKVNSDTQLYRQAGNSIVVNMLEAILQNLLVENIAGGRQTTIFEYL